MPAQLWYVDPTISIGAESDNWVGPYGTGKRRSAWSRITKAADNWYFGLGGVVGVYPSFWDVTQAGVKIGSYGNGRHILDFTNATLQSSGTRTAFRVRAIDFQLDFIHMKGARKDVPGQSQGANISISDLGQQGFVAQHCILQGPGVLSADCATTTQQTMVRPVINILLGSTPGNWKVIDNELLDYNTGMSIAADCDEWGIFMSNRVHKLTGTDPGNSDGIIFGSTGTPTSSGFRIRIINNEISGFYDQGIDCISLYQGWIEGNKIYNTDVLAAPPVVAAADPKNTAGMILGGHVGTGGHFIARNDVKAVIRPGITYTNVPAMQARGGSNCLIVGNRMVGQGSGYRNTGAAASLGDVSGVNNTLINNTLVSTGTGSNDYPLYQERGENLQMTNCALIGARTDAAIKQVEDGITLRGCKTNAPAWRSSGSVGANDIDGTNGLGASMPSGPDYFPNAALTGAGVSQARQWADLYGCKIPDQMIGGLAPDSRTSAAAGVSRKWWKGWARPGADLA